MVPQELQMIFYPAEILYVTNFVLGGCAITLFWVHGLAINKAFSVLCIAALKSHTYVLRIDSNDCSWHHYLGNDQVDSLYMTKSIFKSLLSYLYMYNVNWCELAPAAVRVCFLVLHLLYV